MTDSEAQQKTLQARNRKLLKDLAAARKFGVNTCPASRHAQMIGEHLLLGNPYPMLTDEPVYCGETMLWTVLALYVARDEIARLQAAAALADREVK